jgi:hypothetical protein
VTLTLLHNCMSIHQSKGSDGDGEGAISDRPGTSADTEVTELPSVLLHCNRPVID